MIKLCIRVDNIKNESYLSLYGNGDAISIKLPRKTINKQVKKVDTRKLTPEEKIKYKEEKKKQKEKEKKEEKTGNYWLELDKKKMNHLYEFIKNEYENSK